MNLKDNHHEKKYFIEYTLNVFTTTKVCDE